MCVPGGASAEGRRTNQDEYGICLRRRKGTTSNIYACKYIKSIVISLVGNPGGGCRPHPSGAWFVFACAVLIFVTHHLYHSPANRSQKYVGSQEKSLQRHARRSVPLV